jgi:hypothetical protein
MTVGERQLVIAPDVRRALRDAAAGMEEHAERIAADIAAALHRDAPVLAGDAGTIEGGAREIVRTFVRTIRSGAPLDTFGPVEGARRRARALARSDSGLGHLLRLCHIGHGALLSAWTRELRSLDVPPEVLLAASAAAHEVTFAWVDHLTQQLSDEYGRERDRRVRAGEAERARTIRVVLAGDVRDPDAMSRTLGYELSRHHTAMVVWAEAAEGDADAILEQAAYDLAQRLGGNRPLLLPISGTVLWAWTATWAAPPPEVFDRLAAEPLLNRVCASVGEPAFGAAGMRDSHRDAEHAFRVAQLRGRRPGGVWLYSRITLAAMMVGDVERTRRFVRAQLGDLAAGDDEHARLRATLRVFLDQRGSRRATAIRLGIHSNTVGNRIRRCEEILGRGLAEGHMELHVALALAQQLGSKVLD